MRAYDISVTLKILRNLGQACHQWCTVGVEGVEEITL